MTEQKHTDPNSPAPDTDQARNPGDVSNPGARPVARGTTPEASGRPPKKKRILNVPLLVITLVVVAVLAPAAYFWHDFQLKRTATSLLDRADVAEKDQDWGTAADYVQRYLRLVPDDLTAQVRLTQTYDKSAKDYGRKQRAIDLYYETLGIVQESSEPSEIAALRGRLVELLLELQRFAPAEVEAEKLREETTALLTVDAGNAEAVRLQTLAARSLALARYGLFRNSARILQSNQDATQGGVWVGAEKEAIGPTFVRALQLNPGDIQLARQMANVCRLEPQIGLYGEATEEPAANKQPGSTETQSPKEQNPQAPPPAPQPLDKAARNTLADQTMDRLVAENANSPRAYLERYLYRAQLAQNEPDAATKSMLSVSANEDLTKAIELAPNDVEACLSAAGNALQKSANAALDKTEQSKLWDEAKTYYQRAIDSTPADPRAYRMLGQLLIAERQQDRAIEILQKGLTNVDASDPSLNLQLAEAFLDKGKLDQTAEESLKKSLEIIQAFQQRSGSQLERAAQLDLQHRTDLLLGRSHVRKGEYETAIPFLKRLTTLGDRIDPAETARRFMGTYLLGQCLAGTGRWEQAAEAFDDAALLRPDVAAVHVLAAEAWSQCGQPSASVQQFEQATQLEPTGQLANWADIWFKLAQARLQEQLQILPRESRVWQGVEAAIAEAVKPGRTPPLSEPWRAGLLEVQYLLVRDVQDADRQQSIERAKTILAKMESDNPAATAMWRSLAGIYQQLDDKASADRACERFSTLQPAGADRFVLKSQLLAARRDFDAARKIINEGLAAVPVAETFSLRLALVALSLQEGNKTQATSELKELQKSQPNNIQILQQLADMAFEQRDLEAVKGWEEALKKVEESSKESLGLLWRYNQARRLLAQATKPQDPNLLEAVKLSDDLRSLRPGWPKSVLLSAMILKRLGRVPEAIDAFKEAIRLGEQQVNVYEMLITLLYQANRLAEAQEYLTQLHEFVPGVESLSGLEVLTAVGRGQTDQAVETARAGAARRPDDPMAHLLLGQMLAVAKKYSESETALRRAVELAPTDVRMYSALFVLYMRTNRQDDARQLLSELAAKEIPADEKETGQKQTGRVKTGEEKTAEKEFVLAQAYQQLGDQAAAEAHYRQARQLDPKNTELLSRMAAFLAEANPTEAEKLLREAKAIDPSDARLRRGLAALLAAGNEDQWKEAQDLLAGEGDDPAAVVDQRVRAMLLVRRGGRDNLKEARAILEKLVADPLATVESDRLLLARIYEAQAGQLQSDARGLAIAGKLTEAEAQRTEADTQYTAARKQYVALAERSNLQQQADYTGALVEFLLRQRDYEEAERQITQLSKSSPNNLAVVRLQARLLKATGRESEIAAILEPVAAQQLTTLREKSTDTPDTISKAEGQLTLTMGGIYAAADQYAAAEPWLRQAVEKMPTAYGSLAGCLAAQKRVEEGMQLCLDAAKNDPSTKPILTLASLLVLGTASTEDFQRAEPPLSAALAAHPDDAQLIAAVADVRVVQGRLEDAIGLYERVVTAQPDNLFALNNLATLLGEQPNGQEKALGYIDRALEKSGPATGLLDTKGMILFSAGQFDKAKVCLEAATWDPTADPRFFFHLAAACHRLGETEPARKAFEHAKANQLERQILTPSDQALLAELQKAFPG
ncbi:MAG: tetratricopeptide repeat protein [Pirellulaceae bacterium]